MISTRTSVLALVAAAAALAAVAAFAATTMRTIAAAAPIPKDTAPYKLSGFTYETRDWSSTVESIRLAELPAADADQVNWIVRASNSRAKRIRIEIELHLLDATGERLARGQTTLLLFGIVRGKEERIEMKLAPGIWERAKQVRVEARFLSVT